ncbi:DMT family transporter [Rhizobium alvei]|uniref:DMT family transporter n=1 Tax=Rhizobium alvei TaxID=1132659 RepID=A0ABT8YSW4_9HYPH|nr:DMT family transporter [Rhizobium alvei]MDO6966779.1 DMT family transporter [Rhizobium alvei]
MSEATVTAISKTSGTPLGAASALAVVLIWASWLVSTRHSVGSALTPLDLSLMRYGLPALVLAPVWLRTGLWPKGVNKVALVLMIAGSGAPFFQVVGYGLHATPASAAGVLLPGIMPLATALIGVFVLGERPDAIRWVGMAAILSGGLLLLYGGLTDGGLSWVSYVVLPMGATLWAIYTHAFRRSGLTAFEGGALVSIWSTLLNLAALPFVGTHLFEVPMPEIGLHLLTQGVLSGLAATIFYGSAVRSLGSTQAAAFTAITPVAAAIGGIILLGEPLNATIVIAATLTSVGVLLSTGILSQKRGATRP